MTLDKIISDSKQGIKIRSMDKGILQKVFGSLARYLTVADNRLSNANVLICADNHKTSESYADILAEALEALFMSEQEADIKNKASSSLKDLFSPDNKDICAKVEESALYEYIGSEKEFNLRKVIIVKNVRASNPAVPF